MLILVHLVAQIVLEYVPHYVIILAQENAIETVRQIVEKPVVMDVVENVVGARKPVHLLVIKNVMLALVNVLDNV